VRRAAVDLSSSLPIWSIPPDLAASLRRAFGLGWEVVHVTGRRTADGDGSGPSSEVVDAAVDAEVYLGWGISAEVVKQAGDKLRWVHTAAAGVGGSITPELRSSRAVFTNSRGVHADPMADWVVAAIGFCARGFHVAVAAQREGRWARGELTQLDTPIREFADLRVGLVGYGGVGRAVARQCRALGMTVRAVRRRPRQARRRNLVWLGGPDDLPDLARQSDVLVIAIPHTRETVRMIDESVLALLPRGAYVLNVARGAILDEEALLSHLDSGHLAGCVLDVCGAEPLPADHGLWRHPKVFVTPHVSGVSGGFWAREMALILENIDRYKKGGRLRNLVDMEFGY